MKNYLTIVTTALVLLLSVPVLTHAAAEPVSTTIPLNKSGKSSTQGISTRLDEIRAIDKSTLSSSEKKALREEARVLKKQPNDLSNGVYISAGGVILVIVLLILLL